MKNFLWFIGAMLVLALSVLIILDVGMFRKEGRLYRCFSNAIYDMADGGSIKECRGLFYKVLEYDLEDRKETVLVPFWTKVN